jgi:peptidyl-prolyl cis-trans isomerase C
MSTAHATAPRARRNGLQPFETWVGRLTREPLVHLLLVGAVLFAAGEARHKSVDAHRIVVTPAHIAQIENRYVAQFGKRPDASILDRLIEDDVHDEILFRYGLALKLDREDEIARRRIVQKTRFLLEDLHPPADPTDAQLDDYYRSHAQSYALPARATFTHVFFVSAPDKGRARADLAALAEGKRRASEVGDSFPDLYDFASYEPAQVYRLFGHTEFAESVFSVPEKQWLGPFRSTYGWHFLYVHVREPGQQPAFNAVRSRVRADYVADLRERANRAAFADIARQFTVQGWSPEPRS